MKKFGKFVLAGTALLAAVGVAETFRTVSYTHLTLPTILLV